MACVCCQEMILQLQVEERVGYAAFCGFSDGNPSPTYSQIETQTYAVGSIITTFDEVITSTSCNFNVVDTSSGAYVSTAFSGLTADTQDLADAVFVNLAAASYAAYVTSNVDYDRIDWYKLQYIPMYAGAYFAASILGLYDDGTPDQITEQRFKILKTGFPAPILASWDEVLYVNGVESTRTARTLAMDAGDDDSGWQAVPIPSGTSPEIEDYIRLENLFFTAPHI